MIDKARLEEYLKGLFGGNTRLLEFSRLGAGVHGTGFLINMMTSSGERALVLKDLSGDGLGHDYPSDRASVFLLAMGNYNSLPMHIKSIDVAALREDGSVHSIGGGVEYYLLMEMARGVDYFKDLNAMAKKASLDQGDIKKIELMTSYLAQIHSIRKDSKTLYWRKLRDTIGHGECLMGVLDTYPEPSFANYEDMAEIEKKCIDWIFRLKPMHNRLSQIHGDFHPGNIWFDGDTFTLLDRSRGPWGEPADDITALTINYIFFSLNNLGKLKGPYYEAIKLFYDEYIKKTGDIDIYRVVAPFYAFRGVVVANPIFYPDVSNDNRKRIFKFINGVLEDTAFDVEKINNYLA